MIIEDNIMIWNNKYNYLSSTKALFNGYRHYDINNEKLPSVTSIIEKTKTEEEKASLKLWRERIGEAAAQKISKDAASRGFHVQSTVLSGTKELLIQRVNAFKEGCEILGEQGKLLKLSMQRMAYLAIDEKDAEEKNRLAYEYYKRFDNMFTGPGKVKNGEVEPLPRNQTYEEMKKNLLICPLNEMIDRLGVYAEAGVDEIIVSSSFGQNQKDLINSMHRMSDEIIPYFKKSNVQVA